MNKTSKNYASFDSRPLPKTFVLELTWRCNNACLHCYNVWGTPELQYNQQDQREMSTEEIKDVIVRLQDDTDFKSLGLSGGEPFLRDDLSEILSFVRSRGIGVVVITNGTLLTEERVAETMIGGTYEVTLLSHRKEVHDFMADRHGAWEDVINGMANIRQTTGNLVVVFVATKLNYMDLYKTAELAIALGAYGLMYNRINLSARNIKHADTLLPTPAMIQENLDMLEEIGEKYNLSTAVSVVLEPCVIDIKKYKHIHFGWCPLAGEDSYFTIDPAGNVRICNHSPTIVGNIKQQRFSHIYYHHPYVRKFHNTWPEDCEDCDPQKKKTCRGGCKAAAEQCYGTLSRVDPFVTLCKELGRDCSDSPGTESSN
ncbi:radical SAM/SPASM domain-containing protein [Acidobacteriota bacterium]